MVNRILAGLMVFILAFSSGCAERAETTTAASIATTTQQISSDAAPTTAEPTTTTQKTVATATEEGVPLQPDIMSQFPGALRLMTLTRGDIIALFGKEPVTFENKAQGIDVLKFEDLNLVIQIDTLHNQIQQIRIGEEKYTVSGGTHSRFDVVGDGALEAVATYEDASGIGHVVVYNELDGTLIAETETGSFGGASALSFSDNAAGGTERLIVLDTLADWECDVLSYVDGKLISVLPESDRTLETEAAIKFSENFETVEMTFASIGQSFQCPIPQRLSAILNTNGTAPEIQFVTNRKPIMGPDGLLLRVRTSLQVKLANVLPEKLPGDARYVDVGFAMQEYRYMGKGQWKNLKSTGGAKYTANEFAPPIAMEDLHIGQIWLFSPLYDYMEQLNIAEGTYADVDLVSGVVIPMQGLNIHVSNVKIAGLTLELGSEFVTERGLSTGVTRETVLALYGLPDKGYYEDDIWTWWYFRDWQGETSTMMPEDVFQIEFKDNIVQHIEMRGAVPN